MYINFVICLTNTHSVVQCYSVDKDAQNYDIDIFENRKFRIFSRIERVKPNFNA